MGREGKLAGSWAGKWGGREAGERVNGEGGRRAGG